MDENEELLALMSRVAKHDKKAFTELHLKVSRRVFAFISLRIRDYAMAEEVLSETMFAVWGSAEKFRGESKVIVWILGLAKNKSLMALRTDKTRRENEVPLEPIIDPDNGNPDPDRDLIQRIADPGLDPLAHIEKVSQEVRIRHCIRKLPAPHRECVTLVYYQELSGADTASVLDIPENTVKSRLKDAREKLLRCYRGLSRTSNPSGASS